MKFWGKQTGLQNRHKKLLTHVVEVTCRLWLRALRPLLLIYKRFLLLSSCVLGAKKGEKLRKIGFQLFVPCFSLCFQKCCSKKRKIKSNERATFYMRVEAPSQTSLWGEIGNSISGHSFFVPFFVIERHTLAEEMKGKQKRSYKVCVKPPTKYRACLLVTGAPESGNLKINFRRFEQHACVFSHNRVKF